MVNAGNTLIATQTFRYRCKFERFAFSVKFVKRWTSAGVNRHGVTAALHLSIYHSYMVSIFVTLTVSNQAI